MSNRQFKFGRSLKGKTFYSDKIRHRTRQTSHLCDLRGPKEYLRIAPNNTLRASLSRNTPPGFKIQRFPPLSPHLSITHFVANTPPTETPEFAGNTSQVFFPREILTVKFTQTVIFCFLTIPNVLTDCQNRVLADRSLDPNPRAATAPCKHVSTKAASYGQNRWACRPVHG